MTPILIWVIGWMFSMGLLLSDPAEEDSYTLWLAIILPMFIWPLFCGFVIGKYLVTNIKKD